MKLREFGAVRDLLALGYALGLADGPAASQAAELLGRLATFADITRAPRAGAGRPTASAT